MVERQRAGEPGAAHLLRPALEQAAEHRHVLVHVDERTEVRRGAARSLDLEHDDRLAVLREHGIEQLRAVGRRLPVGEVDGAAPRRGAYLGGDEARGAIPVAL